MPKPAALVLCALISSALLFALGGWQLKRLQWKKQLLSKMEVRLALPARQIAAAEDIEYSRVVVIGSPQSDKNIHLYSYRGKELGYDIILPLKISNKGTEDIVLISTGWRKIEAPSESPKNSSYHQEIKGIAEPIKNKTVFFVKNNLEKNKWYRLNMQDIREYFGSDQIKPYVVWQEEEFLRQHKNIPVNHHLGYAIMWCTLGIISIVIWSIKFFQNLQHCRQKIK